MSYWYIFYEFSIFVLILGFLVVFFGSLAKDCPFEPYKKNSRRIESVVIY